MGDYLRRSDDNQVVRALKFWPVILSTVVLVGTAFVVRQDVGDAKDNIRLLAQTSIDHEKRIIRVEEAVKSIAEMRDELKQLNSLLLRMANRQDR